MTLYMLWSRADQVSRRLGDTLDLYRAATASKVEASPGTIGVFLVVVAIALVDECDPLCKPHHDLKTYQGWDLVEGTGKRPIVPPDDPRHSNNWAPPREGLAFSAVEKLCYGIWRAADQELEPIERALVHEVGPVLLSTNARGVRVLVEEPKGAILRVGAQADSGNLLCGSVSIWLDSLDDRGEAESIIASTPAAETHGWLVTESIPLGYGEHRSWPDGERSPGLSITTVFDKKRGLADEDFYRIWHGEHTPLSFVIHPLWLYVRNAVVRPVTDSAQTPDIRSYVYEATPTFEDMLDFHRFFGSGGDNGKLKTNIDRVNNHMETFAETSTLQCTPMAEYVFRTFST